MDFCPKCGFSFEDEVALDDREDLNFCPKCGKQLDGFSSIEDSSAGDLESEVVGLLRKKQYIVAVKHVREKTGQGLKESRDQVRAIAKNYNINPSVTAGSAKARFLAYLIVGGFLGLMISSAGIAIYPKFGMVASPFLCDGELVIKSGKLYTPPGRGDYSTGVSRSFHCEDGTPKTFMVFLISTVVYTLIFIVLLYIRNIYKNIRGHTPSLKVK